MPRVRLGGASFFAPVAIGGKIYVFVHNPGVVDIYDPATNTWALGATTGNLPVAIGPAVLDGRIYFFGNGAGAMYDPSTDTWTWRAPMASGRVEARGAVLGGKLYAFSGYEAPVPCFDVLCSGARSDRLEVFDPATNTWTSRKSMPVNSQITFADTLGGKLLIGVFGEDFTQTENFVHLYDPERNEWAVRASVPLANSGLLPTPRALSVNGALIAIFATATLDRSAVFRFNQ